jgi:hypothetical protein
MLLDSLDKEGSCCLNLMAHNQIIEVVSDSRMTIKPIVMVSHQVYCITIRWDVLHVWLARKGIPSGEKSRKFHVEYTLCVVLVDW